MIVERRDGARVAALASRFRREDGYCRVCALGEAVDTIGQIEGAPSYDWRADLAAKVGPDWHAPTADGCKAPRRRFATPVPENVPAAAQAPPVVAAPPPTSPVKPWSEVVRPPHWLERDDDDDDGVPF